MRTTPNTVVTYPDGVPVSVASGSESWVRVLPAMSATPTKTCPYCAQPDRWTKVVRVRGAWGNILARILLSRDLHRERRVLPPHQQIGGRYRYARCVAR